MKFIKDQLKLIDLEPAKYKTIEDAFEAIVSHYISESNKGAYERLLKSKYISDETISDLAFSYKQQPFVFARRIESIVISNIFSKLKEIKHENFRRIIKGA